MKYDYLFCVMETKDIVELNEKLKNSWRLLDTSKGQKENGEAYFLYSLGKFDEDAVMLDNL